MIERLVREKLNKVGYFDMENRNSQTYRTFYSIIESNEEKLKSIFPDDVMAYLKYTYKKNGIRNKVLHYNYGLQLSEVEIYNAKVVFLKILNDY